MKPHRWMFTLLLCSLTLLNLSALSQTDGSPLLLEAQRQLSIMKTTHYQHKTSVSEAEGRFDYDCSGFVVHTLRKVSQDALAELPISKPSSGRPLAQDFYALFSGLNQPSAHWAGVLRPIDLQPGDIVSWLRPPDNDTNNTGHLMVVREKPRVNPKDSTEVLIPVMDSTSSPHAQDSRAKGQTGLGTGTIGIIVDAQGLPISYRWRGGESKREEATPIAFGRLLGN